jgi:ATP-GRASP peptide maturase of grasp-with-spasm system
MVLILSTESDFTTSEVIKWLRYAGKPYIRINGNDTIFIKSANMENGEFNIAFQINNNGQLIQTKDITSYWYRRGGLFHNKTLLSNIKLSNIALQELIKNNIKNDIETLTALLIYTIERKKSIGSIHTAINNKLIHLSVAKRFNILVPLTKIISTRQEFLELKETKKDFITKCMSDGVHYIDNSEHYALYTQEINWNEKLTNSFLPVLIQECIKKRWEIRTFYLKGEFYSMAIFSQRDSQTSLDFRKYNLVTPNYRVPYKLPLLLEKKLRKFMNEVELDTGSIDLVYSQEGEYYFLEVNPVGQFGMVSRSCNYFLEKKIASNL